MKRFGGQYLFTDKLLKKQGIPVYKSTVTTLFPFHLFAPSEIMPRWNF